MSPVCYAHLLSYADPVWYVFLMCYVDPCVPHVSRLLHAHCTVCTWYAACAGLHLGRASDAQFAVTRHTSFPNLPAMHGLSEFDWIWGGVQGNLIWHER